MLNVATSHSRVWHKGTSCKHRQKDGKLMKITLIQLWDCGTLSKFTVPGDGECLFISAAMNIKHSSQLGTESYWKISLLIQHLIDSRNRVHIMEGSCLERTLEIIIHFWFQTSCKNKHRHSSTVEHLQEYRRPGCVSINKSVKKPHCCVHLHGEHAHNCPYSSPCCIIG